MLSHCEDCAGPGLALDWTGELRTSHLTSVISTSAWPLLLAWQGVLSQTSVNLCSAHLGRPTDGRYLTSSVSQLPSNVVLTSHQCCIFQCRYSPWNQQEFDRAEQRARWEGGRGGGEDCWNAPQTPNLTWPCWPVLAGRPTLWTKT